MPGTPTTIFVARTHLVSAAIIAVIGLFGGMAIQLEHWAPGRTWTTPAGYAHLHGVHSILVLGIVAPTLAGCFGYRVVGELVGARRVIAPQVAWFALAAWLVSIATIALTALIPSHDATGWSFFDDSDLLHTDFVRIAQPLFLIGLAVSGLTYAVHLAVQIVSHIRVSRPSPARMAIAGGLVISIAIASVAFWVGDRAAPLALSASGFFAVTLSTWMITRTSDARHERLVLASIVCGAICAFTPLRLLGLVTVVAWFLSMPRDQRRPSPVVILGVAPALALHSLLDPVAWLLSTDVHLSDTYYATAGFHVMAAIIVFTGVAALHTWAAPLVERLPRPRLLWLATVLSSSGTLLLVTAYARLGMRGMPHSYYDYDPPFTTHHQFAVVSAVIAVAGLVLFAVAWLLGRPPKAENEPATPGTLPLAELRSRALPRGHT